MSYNWRWAAVYERNLVDLKVGGKIETHQRITVDGEMTDEKGENVVLAVLEQNKNIGRLVHIEVMQG